MRKTAMIITLFISLVILYIMPPTIASVETGGVPGGSTGSPETGSIPGGSTSSSEQEASGSSKSPVFSSDKGSSTHSRGSYYIGPQGQVVIEKYTKRLKEIYDKDENITIRLKIVNCNRRNRLEDVYIREEIPEEFELVSAIPNNYREIPPYESGDKVIPRMIEWRCDDNIGSTRIFDYTVRTNQSGKHLFSSTLLGATVRDYNGRTYEILQTSDNDLFVTIENSHPKIEWITTEERSTCYKNGENINIKVYVTDRNLEPITCEIYSDKHKYVSTDYTPEIVEMLKKPCYSFNFTLNDSNYEVGSNMLNIKASDGETESTAELNIEIYRWCKWLPSDITVNSDIIVSNIFNILGFLITGIIGLLLGRKSKKA